MRIGFVMANHFALAERDLVECVAELCAERAVETVDLHIATELDLSEIDAAFADVAPVTVLGFRVEGEHPGIDALAEAIGERWAWAFSVLAASVDDMLLSGGYQLWGEDWSSLLVDAQLDLLGHTIAWDHVAMIGVASLVSADQDAVLGQSVDALLERVMDRGVDLRLFEGGQRLDSPRRLADDEGLDWQHLSMVMEFPLKARVARQTARELQARRARVADHLRRVGVDPGASVTPAIAARCFGAVLPAPLARAWEQAIAATQADERSAMATLGFFTGMRADDYMNEAAEIQALAGDASGAVAGRWLPLAASSTLLARKGDVALHWESCVALDLAHPIGSDFMVVTVMDGEAVQHGASETWLTKTTPIAEALVLLEQSAYEAEGQYERLLEMADWAAVRVWCDEVLAGESLQADVRVAAIDAFVERWGV